MKNKTIKILYTCSLLAFSPFIHAEECTESDCENDEYCFTKGRHLVSIGADWLFWEVEQQKMQIGAEVSITTSDDEFNIASKVLAPKFKTKSGYRIFTDYVPEDHSWKLSASFTHAPTTAGFSHSENPANISFDFISLFNTNFPLLSAISGSPFTSVSSKWNADINYLDLDIARTFSFCECFAIKPHIGIRGLWINQKLQIDGNSDDITFTSNMKITSKGIGIEGGLWGTWDVACGISLVGHFGGSLIYTRLHNRGSLTGTDVVTSNISYSDTSHISLPTVDSFIGLAYKADYGDLLMDVCIGWEHHVILNTNQYSLSGGGDMTLQGLTLGADFTF